MFSTSKNVNWTRPGLPWTLAVVVVCATMASQETPSTYTFKSETELVLVNVTVRDKSGNPVRDLKQEDFTVLEDNKPQQVSSFDLENTDAILPTAVSEAPLLGKALSRTAHVSSGAPQPMAASELKDRRLIILFFDLSSMQPDEIDRATTSGENYVDKQMVPADLVAVICLGSSLTVNQDFTSDKNAIKKTLQKINLGGGQGFEEGSTGSTEGTPDTGGSFTADDTEYNIFNTDRRLEALRSVADRLSHVDEKKSLIYFSSGMDRTGIENQSELHAAINAAVRANLSIYTMDIRGLQAIVPGGEAQNASLRGTSPYSGQASLNALNSNFTTQETLVTLAGDTGGRAFLDSNDFSRVFTGVQQDTSVYYLLGYYSNNSARDGRFRKITVRVNRPGVKIDFRRGYYAPADFQHSTKEDRELQLDQELASDLPSTDLPVYLSAAYFRMSDGRFYVPVSVVVPGSQIPFTRSNEQDRATLDVLGVVTSPDKRPIGQIRETVKLSLNTTELVGRKNVQYDNGFVLPSGKYHLKFVIRENQTGRLGSFETDFTIPDLKGVPVKMSSVVLASQVRPAGKRKSDNPLVRDGSEVIPSVTHVFSAGQHLYFYYEVYDPTREPISAAAQSPAGAKSGIRVLTNVAFFSGKKKVYETPVVESAQLNTPQRRATVFQLDVPLTQLKPGFYTCQVNVIDDAAGQFLFPRLSLLVRQ
ncbi:MAG TPA: VWA domain-containing protein [Terriglobales bacterium]|jgi:VWFA-related protein|nr:VWA domain-containing protein [Terriglobales bacterium]